MISDASVSHHVLYSLIPDNLGNSGVSGSSSDFWRSYSAYTSGYQSVDHLSDIDEFEESFKVICFCKHRQSEAFSLNILLFKLHHSNVVLLIPLIVPQCHR